ncbi:MAG: hypothetical protein MZW92_33075 [Comamonadaceae bacterium]|nr:hypothetical protein [Comamonadaceae bacterium]
MAGMLVLLGDDLRAIERRPFAALMILGAAFVWACGTVLLRKFQPKIPQNALTGWMMIAGWVPIALAAPLLDLGWRHALDGLSATAWFAIAYNIVHRRARSRTGRGSRSRARSRSRCRRWPRCPCPIVGVFAGMLVLGERPGTAEWLALALVLAALVAVLWPAQRKDAPIAPAPDEG